MTRFSILICSLFLASGLFAQDEIIREAAPTDMVGFNFDWILGDWERTNDELGKETYESWTKEGNSYIGHGYTIQEIEFQRDTISQEFMKLSGENFEWILEVSIPGVTDKPVQFIMSELQDKSFICVNAKNDFPKSIMYSKWENGLFAEISGGGESVSFDFRKR